MAKTDIDDATGVTSADADKAEQSTRNTVSLLLGAAALLYARNQLAEQPEPPVKTVPEPVNVEVQPDIQDLGHPRPLAGGYDDMPPYDARELPPDGGTTPPAETLHTAYPEDLPVAISLRVGDEQIETNSNLIADDIQQLDNLEVVQRAIDNQSLSTDPDVEIQVEGDRVFYQGPEERYVHPDFDLQSASELVSGQRSEMERDDGAVVDTDASPLNMKVGRADREVPDAGPEATQQVVVQQHAPLSDRPTTQGKADPSAPVESQAVPEAERLTTEVVPLSVAEAIAGQNEGDVSTDNAEIWAAQPTVPTITKDSQGRIVGRPSMEGLEATVDLVERREDQAEWIQERLEGQQAKTAVHQQVAQDQQLATMFDRCLEVCYGQDGSASIVGNSYDISRDGQGGLSVTANDGRGTIFERDGQSGEIASAITPKDLQKFAAGAAVLEKQQASSQPTLPPIPRFKAPTISRQSEMEIG